ncbi:MAG: hypothetical protein WD885_01585 [Candidatus Saccharimonadales bacterium]
MNDDNLIQRPAPDVDRPTDNSLSQNTTSIPIPPEAEDSDLIEKEWVERAKQIVAHTRHDPHEQQKALSLMKADYMKKRYNRDVKVSKRDVDELKPDSEN